MKLYQTKNKEEFVWLLEKENAMWAGMYSLSNYDVKSIDSVIVIVDNIAWLESLEYAKPGISIIQVSDLMKKEVDDFAREMQDNNSLDHTFDDELEIASAKYHDAIEPSHYRKGNSKYIDLIDKAYHENTLEAFRAIMKFLAERYITRYEEKNGIEDLEKGIYVLERLKEYEEMELEK